MNNTVGDNLQRAIAVIIKFRKRRGLSLRQLGKLSGVNFATINNIESGAATSPSFNVIDALAAALGVVLQIGKCNTENDTVEDNQQHSDEVVENKEANKQGDGSKIGKGDESNFGNSGKDGRKHLPEHNGPINPTIHNKNGKRHPARKEKLFGDRPVDLEMQARLRANRAKLSK